MTGFGRARQEGADGFVVSAEIKSLNSKQLDLRLRLPQPYLSKEAELRQLLSTALVRGKVDVILDIENEQQNAYQINRQAFEQYYYQLLDIAGNNGIALPDPIPTICRLPGVVQSGDAEIDPAHWDTIVQTCQAAIEAFRQFRLTEGAVLEEDIRQRVRLIEQYLQAVEPYEQERITSTRERLRTGLEQAQLAGKIDHNRFEQELIYYLEKFDVSEEKTRLRQHCSYFIEELEQPTESQGRKLNFILQEMGREINTLGSKANHASIQRLVIQMKDEAEKIKEQLANIL